MPVPPIDQLRASAESGDPQAQFLLSQLCAQRGDLPEMLHWLEKAAEQRIADAMCALGQAYECGTGVQVDTKKASSLYGEAAALGSPAAMYFEAQLSFKTGGDEDLVRDLLRRAAQLNFVPALRTVGYFAAQGSLASGLAEYCLTKAAELGDLPAAFLLGLHFRSAGDDRRAAHWLQIAEQAGYPLAREAIGEVRTAERDRVHSAAPIEESSWTEYALESGRSPSISRQLSDDPRIVVHEQVLDLAQRSYLMYLSTPRLERARVIDPDGDGSGMVSGVRSNSSTYIPGGYVDLIARTIEQRIAQAVGENLAHSEPMSILRYQRNQEYAPHFDFFNPRLDVSRDLMRDGGQRIASAVTYLSSPDAGGGTSFPHLGITVSAVAGDTLWFRNCTADGDVDKRSLHSGDPVLQGEKWVVTKWFRERRTHYLET